MIGIIDYGLGNITAFSRIYNDHNIPNLIIKSSLDLDEVNKIILPGVGAFDDAIIKLKSTPFFNKLLEDVKIKKKPILGVCVGMQIMGASSDEGKEIGLCLSNFNVTKICSKSNKLTLPHMGWNSIKTTRNSSIINGVNEENGFYFLHSYGVVDMPSEQIVCNSHYGEDFISGFQNDNVFGFQFHPEKSHENGSILLKNFYELKC